MAITVQLVSLCISLVLARRPSELDTVIAVKPESAFVLLSTSSGSSSHREVASSSRLDRNTTSLLTEPIHVHRQIAPEEEKQDSISQESTSLEKQEKQEPIKDANAEAPKPKDANAEVPKPKDANAEASKIPVDWMDFLYQLIVEDGKDGIDQDLWREMVKGRWEAFMWTALDRSGDKKVDQKEFKSQWETAITATFVKMGGDDGSIDGGEIDKWTPAADYEKQFATNKLLEEGQLNRAGFEAFVFTAMVFRAADKDGNGVLTWEKVQKSKDINGKFGDKAAFQKEFGAHGMKIEKLYQFLKKNSAFGKVAGQQTRVLWTYSLFLLVFLALPMCIGAFIGSPTADNDDAEGCGTSPNRAPPDARGAD